MRDVRDVRERNRGVLENNENGGVEILSAIWWGNGAGQSAKVR